MKLRVMLGGTIALVSAAVLAGRAGADAEKTPTIKDVMVKLHKEANSPLAQLQGTLRAEEPAWEKIQDRSKDFVNLGAALAKNEPPRGDLVSLAASHATNSGKPVCWIPYRTSATGVVPCVVANLWF